MAPRPSRSKKRIVLACADPRLARAVLRALGSGRYVFTTERRASDLAATCRRRRPDLVLADVTLRGLDLTRIAGAPGAPLVLAIASPGRAAKALRKGAADCVLRPVRREVLARRVERMLELAETRASLERGRQRIAALAAKLAGLRTQGGSAPWTAGAELLVGPPQRERILERLDEAIAAARSSGGPVAFLYVDLDLGRAFPLAPSKGSREKALGALVHRMREGVRDHDTVGHLGSRMHELSLARLGSEEFGILMPGLARPQDAYKVAQRIQDALGRRLVVGEDDISVASSWGIAMWPTDGPTAESLHDAAQAACRAARSEERGGIRFCTARTDAAAVERLTLEFGLRRALETGELFVHYQPRVDLVSGRICGFEALVRWRHPDLGIVSPGRFIPIAEETGLIVPIGEFVLQEACAQARTWQRQGLPAVRMGVNLSSVQFRDPELPRRVGEILETVDLAPEWLELELTESVLLHKAEATLSRLHQLKQMGLRLSIDDFGTGYSSLSYLKRFPIDALKIDQSFIREVTTSPEDAAITTSIVLMGKALDLDVVAEGVETRSQLSFLRVIECHEAQGFLFSPAVPAPEAGALLANGLPADLAA